MLNVGSGGGAAPAAGGAAGGASGGDAGGAEAAKEEEKEEGTSHQVLECIDKTSNQFCHREGRVRRRHGIRSIRLSVLNFLLPFSASCLGRRGGCISYLSRARKIL